MRNYRLLITVAVFFLIGVFSLVTSATAKIYINNTNEDIHVNEGDSLTLPIYIVPPDGKPFEMFIWTEELENASNKFFLEINKDVKWTKFSNNSEIKSLAGTMTLDYILAFGWPFDTKGLKSFKMNMCIDEVVDGIIDPQSCSQRVIYVQPNCTGLSVTQDSITKTFIAGQPDEPVKIDVTNSCGNPVDFEPSTTSSLVTLEKQTGVLTVHFKTISPTSDKQTFIIRITRGEEVKDITVNLTIKVQAQTCTLTATPPSISETLKMGTSKDVLVTVKNSCADAPVSATGTVGWIRVKMLSNVQLQVTLDATSLGAGSYKDDKVKITSNSGSYDVPVLLTVNKESTPILPDLGTCNPASVGYLQIDMQAAQGTLPAANTTVRDNCGKPLSYTGAAVTLGSDWLAVDSSSNTSGVLTVKVIKTTLPIGSYIGQVKLTPKGYAEVSVAVNLQVGGANTTTTTPTTTTPTTTTPTTTTPTTTTPTTTTPTTTTPTNSKAIKLDNYNIIYNSYSPGQVRYFYFNENSDLGRGNKNSLIVSQMDMTAKAYNNIDMLIKYVGPTCGSFDPVTIYTFYKEKLGTMTHQQSIAQGYYSQITGDAFETVEIPNNPEGCYYVMVYNASKASESSISLKYEDGDSKMWQPR